MKAYEKLHNLYVKFLNNNMIEVTDSLFNTTTVMTTEEFTDKYTVSARACVHARRKEPYKLIRKNSAYVIESGNTTVLLQPEVFDKYFDVREEVSSASSKLATKISQFIGDKFFNVTHKSASEVIITPKNSKHGMKLTICDENMLRFTCEGSDLVFDTGDYCMSLLMHKLLTDYAAVIKDEGLILLLNVYTHIHAKRPCRFISCDTLEMDNLHLSVQKITAGYEIIINGESPVIISDVKHPLNYLCKIIDGIFRRLTSFFYVDALTCYNRDLYNDSLNRFLQDVAHNTNGMILDNGGVEFTWTDNKRYTLTVIHAGGGNLVLSIGGYTFAVNCLNWSVACNMISRVSYLANHH